MKKLILFLILLFFIKVSFACSMFSYTKNAKTMVGRNMDWVYINTAFWFVNGENGEYGRVCFDSTPEKFTQGGMNEKGLICGTFAVPYRNKLVEKKNTVEENLIDLILANCATIDDVKSYLDKYQSEEFNYGQYMFVDQNGKSIIYEGDKFIEPNGDYQLSTNFYQSEIDENKEVSCERYKLGRNILDTIQVANFENTLKIVSALHVESSLGGTLYSLIYDPANLKCWLYNYHNYAEAYEIDLLKELKKGDRLIEMNKVFIQTYANNSFIELNTGKSRFEKEMGMLLHNYGVDSLLNNYKKKFEGYKKAGSYLEEYNKILDVYDIEDDASFEVAVLNNIAQELMKNNRHDEALKIVEVNAELFPNKSSVYVNLAKLALINDNTLWALIHYEKALSLDPDNKLIIESINQLKEKENTKKLKRKN